MLDAVHPWGRKIRPFCPPNVFAQVACETWQVEEHFRVREQIFCAEQRVFYGSDRDTHDGDAHPIIALHQIAGVGFEVVGVVRIYPDLQRPGTWFGGRLGVRESHRRVGAIGTALITCAVSTAHSLGCTEFLATVQPQNVKYFERHDFHVLCSIEVQGRPHALMEARLESYPTALAGGPVFASQWGVQAGRSRASDAA